MAGFFDDRFEVFPGLKVESVLPISPKKQLPTPKQLKQICIENLKPSVSESDKKKHQILCDAISGKKIIKSGLLENYFKNNLHKFFGYSVIIEAIFKKLGQNTKCGFLHEIEIITNNNEQTPPVIKIFSHIGKPGMELKTFDPNIYFINEIFIKNRNCKTFAIPLSIRDANGQSGHENMLVIEKIYNSDGNPLIENGKKVIHSEHFEPNGIFKDYEPIYETVKNIVTSLFGNTYTIYHYTPTLLCPIHLQNRLQTTVQKKWGGTCTTFSILYSIFRIFFINMTSEQVYNYIESMLVKYGPNNYIRNVVVALINYLDFEIDKTNGIILINGRELPQNATSEILNYYNKIISNYNAGISRKTRSKANAQLQPLSLSALPYSLDDLDDLGDLSFLLDILSSSPEEQPPQEQPPQEQPPQEQPPQEQPPPQPRFKLPPVQLIPSYQLINNRSRSRSRSRQSETPQIQSIRDRSRERYRTEQKEKNQTIRSRGGKSKLRRTRRKR